MPPSKTYRRSYFRDLWATISKSLKINRSYKQPQRCSVKKGVLKNFAIVTPTQVFSYEHYEIFKSTYFEEHLRMTASTFSQIDLKKKYMKTCSLLFLTFKSLFSKLSEDSICYDTYSFCTRSNCIRIFLVDLIERNIFL